MQTGVLTPSTPNLVVNLVGIATQVGLWYYLRQTLDDDETVKGVLGRRAGRRFEAMRS